MVRVFVRARSNKSSEADVQRHFEESRAKVGSSGDNGGSDNQDGWEDISAGLQSQFAAIAAYQTNIGKTTHFNLGEAFVLRWSTQRQWLVA